MKRFMLPVFILLLTILQVVSTLIFTSDLMDAFMSILGILIVLVVAIKWEFKGAIYFATLFSAVIMIDRIFSPSRNTQWTLITITIFIYYIIGIGIGFVVGKLRRQKLDLLMSEERYKSINMELINEKERLRITLQSIGDGVIGTDNKGNVTMINEVAKKLTGWLGDTAIGMPFEEVFVIINEYTRKKHQNIVQNVLETGDVLQLANHTILISKDGTERPVEDSAAPIILEDNKLAGVVLIFRDCSEKRKKQDYIEFLSNHDQLTGLHNRRYYEQEVKRLDDDKYYPLTLVIADVNGLKLTNDAFGHKVGDLLLQQISRVLKKECRETDILVRIGGDEFVLLLPKTDAANAKNIINRINLRISKEKIENAILSISVGYAVKQDSSEDMNEVFMRAEDDMYRHKLSESTSIRSRTVDLIMTSLFEKNNREMLHSKRVSEICEAISLKMNFSKDDVRKMKIAGLMHDIGKIGISETILNDSEPIDDNQWMEIKRHSEIGYRILSSVNEFSEIANYVLEHHERWDGKGYPKGLKGEEISIEARIITIADSYDAMISERSYRKSLNENEAISEIRRCSGTQFDSEIAKLFIEKVLGED